jgi:hypothetical protein
MPSLGQRMRSITAWLRPCQQTTLVKILVIGPVTNFRGRDEGCFRRARHSLAGETVAGGTSGRNDRRGCRESRSVGLDLSSGRSSGGSGSSSNQR